MPLVVKFDVVFVFAAKIAEEADLPELEPQLEDDASDFGVYFLLFKWVQINNKFKPKVTN